MVEPTLERQLPPVVMVVDDNSDTLEMYEELLSSAGVWVTGTTRIDEALECALDLQPDMVLSGLTFNRTVTPGLEFIRQLKAQPKLRAVPVVLVLDSDTPDAGLEELQVDALLKKPVEPARLLEHMRLALEQSQRLRETSTRLRASLAALMTRPQRAIDPSRTVGPLPPRTR